MSHLKHLNFLIDQKSEAGDVAENVPPILAPVLAALRASDRALEGRTYQFSGDNSLPQNWLIQCLPDRQDCELLIAIRALLAETLATGPAQPHFVDITHLANDAIADPFQEQMLDAMLQAVKGIDAPVTIRYLEGNAHDASRPQAFDFANMVLEKTRGVPGLDHVTMYFANLDIAWLHGLEKGLPGSWNHAKIFAADGVSSIVGGMNYWSDYLPENNPVYDVSMRANGTAAASSQRFADYLWADGVSSGEWSSHKSLKLGASAFGTDLPASFDQTMTPPAGSGSLPMLAVGNLGLWTSEDQGTLLAEFLYNRAYYPIRPTNTYPIVMEAANVPLRFPFWGYDFGGAVAQQASVAARHILLQQMKPGQRIRISQQKIADTDTINRTTPDRSFVIWPGDFLDDICRALAAGVDVDILVSHHNSSFYGGYSDDMGGAALRGVIEERVKSAAGTLTIRQIPEGKWNHGKIWIADEEAFFVGSDNIYPGYLQEYGFIVADKPTTQDFISQYWEPIWNEAVAP